MGNLQRVLEEPVAPKVLIYADSGAGKTELASKLALAFNLIVLDMENSLDTFLKLPQYAQDRVTYIGIRDDVQAPYAFNTVNKIFLDKKVSVCYAHGKVGCLACKRIDTPEHPAFQQLDLNDFNPKDTVILVDSMTRYSESTYSDVTKGVDSEKVGVKPEYDHWGALKRRMENFCAMIQHCSFPVVVISHVQMMESKEKILRFYPIGGSRSTASGITKAFNTVIYLERKNGKHVSDSTTMNPKTVSKSRAEIEVSLESVDSFLDIFRPPNERVIFTPEYINAKLEARYKQEKENQEKAKETARRKIDSLRGKTTTK